MYKMLKDGILKSIVVEEEVIHSLIHTKEFQRMSNIKQLAMTYYIFPTATNTRFAHSIGVYEISRRIVNRLDIKDLNLKLAIMIAALLHDLGHGMMSHVFEKITNVNHENLTVEMIENKETEINKVLMEFDPNIMNVVVKIIKGEHEFPWVNSIISSEIDVDRADYLLRDSITTGKSLGLYDLDWLIQNIKIFDNELVFDVQSLSTLETFIIGRYHMYVSINCQTKNLIWQQLIIMLFNNLFEVGIDALAIDNTIKKDLHDLENKKIDSNKIQRIDDIWFWTLIDRLKPLNINKNITKIISCLDHNKLPYFEEDNKKVERPGKNIDDMTLSDIEIDDNFIKYLEKGNKQTKVLSEGKIYNIRDFSSIIDDAFTSKGKSFERHIFIDLSK